MPADRPAVRRRFPPRTPSGPPAPSATRLHQSARGSKCPPAPAAQAPAHGRGRLLHPALLVRHASGHRCPLAGHAGGPMVLVVARASSGIGWLPASVSDREEQRLCQPVAMAINDFLSIGCTKKKLGKARRRLRRKVTGDAPSGRAGGDRPGQSRPMPPRWQVQPTSHPQPAPRREDRGRPNPATTSLPPVGT